MDAAQTRPLLVTGGAGFIGSNFVLGCVQAGQAVVNLDLLTYAGNLENLAAIASNPLHQFVQGDIKNRALLDRLLKQFQPRAIIHFAAESHVDRSILEPADFIQTNIVGTSQLLEAARTHWDGLGAEARASFRFLHISTDEVYGSLSEMDPAFHEDSPHQPNSPYSASKAAGDHLVRAYHHTYGLPVLTTHCSNNYGPYQFPEKLIPLVIQHALQDRPLPVYGDGLQVRDWLHVNDHCSALHAVLQRGRTGQTYNIGGNSPRTNLDVVHSICGLLDTLHPRTNGAPHRSLITFVTDRPGHDLRYAIDARKIASDLGWTPKKTFESGLLQTVQWYLANQPWARSVTNRPR